jgi:branched-chain amino acid transport system ATP-binding protein
VAERTTASGLTPTDAAIGVADLTRQFGAIVAVDDVDLAVPAGELRAIIGPNGAGKTTLFNVITNRIPPSAGTVWLDGRDVTALLEERRPHLGLARSFQSNELFNDLTALENVRIVAQTAETGTFSLDLLRTGRSVAAERAHELLARVDLAGKHDVDAANLSHGDQRRLGLAMALATDPNVLLLDEPTSGMGPGETEETAELIESVQTDLGLTVLLIEHDMDIVLSISDRITVLNQGRVLATGAPEEIQANESVQEAYLGGMREAL